MTVTPVPRVAARTWLPHAGVRAARNSTLFPRSNVIVEVKPHTPSGVTAGIRQLRGRRRDNTTRLFLITYRQVDGDPSRYDVLLGDPGQVQAAVNLGSWRPVLRTWYSLPRIEAPEALRPIPTHQCYPTLGVMLEPRVLLSLQQWMVTDQGHTGFTLASRNPRLRGEDARFELAEFLRELAHELETGYP